MLNGTSYDAPERKVVGCAQIYIKGRKGIYPCKPEALKITRQQYLLPWEDIWTEQKFRIYEKGTQRTSCSLSAL